MMEPTVEPIPPRYWWLKRIGIAVGILLVALFGLRVWWGWEANRRLKAEIDRIIVSGEPIYPEDFDPKEEIPDDRNAARFLIRAEAALNLTADQTQLLDLFLEDTADFTKRLAELKETIEANAEVFDLVRSARNTTQVDWGLRIRSPAVNTLLPMLSGQRRLGKLLNTAAQYHHVSGRDDLAIDSLGDAFAQGEILSNTPFLVTHFVVLATQGLAARTIEETASTLRVATLGESDTHFGIRIAASRVQVVGLINSLLDDRWYRSSLTRAMVGERMFQHDIVRSVVDGQMSLFNFSGMGGPARPSVVETLLGYPIKPLLYSDGLVALSNSTACVAASEEPNWQLVSAALPRERWNQTLLDTLFHPFSRTALVSAHRAFHLHFRALATRKMAAVALAIRLYQVDHGRRPDVLSDLVPQYLPLLPVDPFANDGRPIAYLPNARHPILYSIGPDGVDNEGAFEFGGGRINPEKLDMPFFLDGNRPSRKEDLDKPVPALPQASEDDYHVPNDDGKNEEEKDSDQPP